MRIGDFNISLKNMSKNKRAYWRNIKRLYDEIVQDGVNIDQFEFIRDYAPTGKVTKQMLEEGKKLTGKELLSCATEYDMKKMEIDNLISQFEIDRPKTERARKRIKGYGRTLRLVLADKLKEMVENFGYDYTYEAWYNLPYEVRSKVASSVSGDRYDGIEQALAMLEQSVFQEGYGEFE